MLKFLTDLFKPETPKAPPVTSETSAGFATGEVAPFLTRLSNNPRFGLPAEFTAAIADALPGMNMDDTRRWQIDGAFDGARVQIDIEVCMDSMDAPGLSFFSTRAAIDEIDKELAAFSKASES
ncbi:hypothetical protein [Leisingera methylohalidivorans]|uniref:Uncharacterized protein n=1 Tax=Leisingera methylohalidivorans DSM 14336 TaxID=999552 RepID=V9VZP3_9RHOB|nr:hypothetical protein [Leisingera methylohalidivorans]AHD02835.1 hypothetical protein METH_02115 [Leisingera methylohalidivorans DSM 14336]